MTATSSDRPLFDQWPALRGRLPWVELGDLPTPVQPVDPALRAAGLTGDFWVKRDDLTSRIYGGNKVRTLEVLFAEARERGATHVYSTGAFGSNHAAATVLHARRVGLEPGAVLFPQPNSETAAENLRVILGSGCAVRPLWHWSALPFGMYRTAREHERRSERAYVMEPGGAVPRGALGYVSAAFELAAQVVAGELPRPAEVVVGVGSTCTSAGLLLGFHYAARRGVGFVEAGRPAPPRLRSVRVTPWPVTSPIRIVRLAVRASRLLAQLARDPSLEVHYRTLRPRLVVDGRYLGRGYGYPTDSGREAIRCFRAVEGLELDTTYSAKSAAAVLDLARAGAPGPVLFWSTKSTVPLPDVSPTSLDAAPTLMRRWLERGRS